MNRQPTMFLWISSDFVNSPISFSSTFSARCCVISRSNSAADHSPPPRLRASVHFQRMPVVSPTVSLRCMCGAHVRTALVAPPRASRPRPVPTVHPSRLVYASTTARRARECPRAPRPPPRTAPRSSSPAPRPRRDSAAAARRDPPRLLSSPPQSLPRK